MEVLSGVASGMAVASLSIQLVDSISTIKTFIHNVKDAPKELERLVDLLERLEALLEDVRALMERQTSLQAQHFPKPSMTIFKCLKSSEKTLEPLQAIVERCTPSKSKTGGGIDKLKSGLKISLKAKDIKDLEARIEREINFLHASLGANCGAILMQLGPALLGNHNNNEAIPQSAVTAPTPSTKAVVIPSMEDHAFSSFVKATRVSSTIIPVRSSFERLGVYRRRIIRSMPGHSGKTKSGSEHGHETIISEDNETTLLCSILGYGLTWIQRQSFGITLPSLSTFQIVQTFPDEVQDVIRNREVQDFQDLLRRGVIHPFSRDHEDWSLLHYATYYQRADIYLLLQKLGLKPHVTIHGESPVSLAFDSMTFGEHGNKIDTYRCILGDTESLYTFNLQSQRLYFERYANNEADQWLYEQGANMLSYEDALELRLRIFVSRWIEICLQHEHRPPSLVQYPILSLDADLLDRIQSGQGNILLWILSFCDYSSDSFIVGSQLLEWLSELGHNIKQFKNYEGGAHSFATDPLKKLVFEYCQERGWRLGYEWVLDNEACGYLLISEYRALVVESWSAGYQDWPFHESVYIYEWKEGYKEWYAKQTVRYQRRMAAKTRKDRARTGQKISKSRMPGEWAW